MAVLGARHAKEAFPIVRRGDQKMSRLEEGDEEVGLPSFQAYLIAG
jgi:hypothetical protein